MWMDPPTLHLNPICISSKPTNVATFPPNTSYCRLIHTSTLAVRQRQRACTEIVVPQTLLGTMICHTVRLSSVKPQHGAIAHRKVAACMLRHHTYGSKQQHAHASSRRPVHRMAAHDSSAAQRYTDSLSNRRRSAVRCAAAGADDPSDSASSCSTASAQHSSMQLCM
jgi:hypothetical protein